MIYIFESSVMGKFSYVVRADDELAAIRKLIEEHARMGGIVTLQSTEDYPPNTVCLSYPDRPGKEPNIYRIYCIVEDLNTIRRF